MKQIAKHEVAVRAGQVLVLTCVAGLCIACIDNPQLQLADMGCRTSIEAEIGGTIVDAAVGDGRLWFTIAGKRTGLGQVVMFRDSGDGTYDLVDMMGTGGDAGPIASSKGKAVSVCGDSGTSVCLLDWNTGTGANDNKVSWFSVETGDFAGQKVVGIDVAPGSQGLWVLTETHVWRSYVSGTTISAVGMQNSPIVGTPIALAASAQDVAVVWQPEWQEASRMTVFATGEGDYLEIGCSWDVPGVPVAAGRLGTDIVIARRDTGDTAYLGWVAVLDHQTCALICEDVFLAPISIVSGDYEVFLLVESASGQKSLKRLVLASSQEKTSLKETHSLELPGDPEKLLLAGEQLIVVYPSPAEFLVLPRHSLDEEAVQAAVPKPVLADITFLAHHGDLVFAAHKAEPDVLVRAYKPGTLKTHQYAASYAPEGSGAISFLNIHGSRMCVGRGARVDVADVANIDAIERKGVFLTLGSIINAESVGVDLWVVRKASETERSIGSKVVIEKALLNTAEQLYSHVWPIDLSYEPRGFMYHKGVLYVFENNGIVVYSAETGKFIGRVLAGQPIEALAVDHDSGVGLVAMDGEIWLLDLSKPAVPITTHRLPEAFAPVHDIDILDSRAMIVSSSGVSFVDLSGPVPMLDEQCDGIAGPVKSASGFLVGQKAVLMTDKTGLLVLEVAP